MQENYSSIQNSSIAESKIISFQTENSIITGSSRKKYFLKLKKVTNQSTLGNSISRTNIFDLTAGTNCQSSSQILSHYNTISQSRIYSNSLFSSPSKQDIKQNPQKKAVLPIITQSKYNFKPSVILPKVSKQKWHKDDPVYIKDDAMVDGKNIKKMKKYSQIWNRTSLLRNDISLMDRSTQKAQIYIQRHNSQIEKRKASIDFQTILRDRHLKQDNRIGVIKANPCRSLPGLKGKGGNVKSLFQQMFAVQQIYKIDK